MKEKIMPLWVVYNEDDSAVSEFISAHIKKYGRIVMDIFCCECLDRFKFIPYVFYVKDPMKKGMYE